MTHECITFSERAIEPDEPVAGTVSGLGDIRSLVPLLLTALGLAGNALPAWAQDTGSVYRPLPLAPADTTSSGGAASGAEDEKAKAAELAKQTLNPIASLISVPFQNNWDFGIGPSDAMRYTLNFHRSSRSRLARSGT